MNIQTVNRVQRSFSRSFGTYHDAACQQAWVAERLAQALIQCGAPREFEHAFELGCGTGHLTRAMHKTCEFGQLTLNDLMAEARQTAQDHGTGFVEGDACAVAWPKGLDLVASASMIQWLPDPGVLIDRAADHLAPGGWLAISGYGPDQFRELAELGSVSNAPGLIGLDRLRAAASERFDILDVGEARHVLRFANPRAVLHHLRETGVNGRARETWTKSTLARFVDTYAARFGTPEDVSLTYHPIWIVARRR